MDPVEWDAAAAQGRLIEEARAVKVELSKMLSASEDAQKRAGEHLRPAVAEDPRVPAASSEDAQLGAFDEHLWPNQPKMLTEDAHLSTFEKPESSCGFRADPAPKMLTLPQVNAFNRAELV